MKKITILSILLVVFTHIMYSQQEWIEEDAIWYYNYYSNSEGIGYEKINYVADTLVEGKMCKKLKRDIYYINFQTFDTVHIDKSSKILFQSGDTIWFHDNVNFFQLFNFSLEIGDTVSFMNFPSIHNNINIVENIQTIELNQEEFKQQTIGVYADGSLLAQIEIVEKLGVVSFPFPFFWNEFTPNVPDWGEWGFRCYSDINFPEINYSNSECEALPVVVNNTTISNEINLEISPNPIIDRVRIITNNQKIDRLRLVDINGRIVLQKRDVFDEINLNWLSNGVYFMEILFRDKRVMKKVIKASH